MCFPSFKRTPPAPVFATRSDPAKSTKFYFQEIKQESIRCNNKWYVVYSVFGKNRQRLTESGFSSLEDY